MNRYEEQYLICQERGHVADPLQGISINAVYGAVGKEVCKYCNTVFWTTTKLEVHEENSPKAEAKPKPTKGTK